MREEPWTPRSVDHENSTDVGRRRAGRHRIPGRVGQGQRRLRLPADAAALGAAGRLIQTAKRRAAFGPLSVFASSTVAGAGTDSGAKASGF
jgi:hypothetical protein